MNWEQLLTDLAVIIEMSAPMLLATMGILLSERAGVINLSVDGSLLLAGMTGFAVALMTNSVVWGFIVAGATGALVAAVVAYLGISLRLSQTAVGFVLALLCTDLSSYLGNPYVQIQGPAVQAWSIPVLADIPVLGVLFFRHDSVIYTSIIVLCVVAVVLARTRIGLLIRGVGEKPETLFARGVDVVRLRYAAVIIGGILIGLAGAAYTLDLKQGWTYRHVAGTGWIALAVVIFGAWQPWRIALGCYLFAVLQMMSTRLQDNSLQIPTQVLQVAPFVVMIVVLAIVNSTTTPWAERIMLRLPAPMRRVIMRISQPAPAALGQPFEQR